mmetsp:Transcript_41857/g.87887  ORF Transcript_41857/g.87887 Transcript_41857/m.87887 type:complete len:151 (-) Transcript_41857:50-502(-)
MDAEREMPVRVRRVVRRVVSEKPVICRRVMRRVVGDDDDDDDDDDDWTSSMLEDFELWMLEDVVDRVQDGGWRSKVGWVRWNEDNDDEDDDEDNDDECLAAIFAGENAVVTLFRDAIAKMHSMVMECHVVDFMFIDLAVFLTFSSELRSR